LAITRGQVAGEGDFQEDQIMGFQKTNIEYLTHTWNPITMRCTPASEGCANCWHIKTVDKRLLTNPLISEEKKDAYAGGLPYINDKSSHIPKGKGRRIGVQFMGDLFHENITFKMIHLVWDVMKANPDDTFIVLTKRPERMKEALERIYSREHFGWALGFWSHVWLGVTVENQNHLARIEELLKIWAAVRFVSVEPMLSEMYLDKLFRRMTSDDKPYYPCTESYLFDLDWVICGAEQGPGKRHIKNAWAQDLQRQCHAARVPFFFKKDSRGINPGLDRAYPKI
jgi:protein gp37